MPHGFGATRQSIHSATCNHRQGECGLKFAEHASGLLPTTEFSAALGVVLGFVALSLSGRSNYVQGFRRFDLSLVEHAKLAETENDPDARRARLYIAQMYLRRSEDYRWHATYFTHGCIYLVLCAYGLVLTVIIDFYVSGSVVWLLFLLSLVPLPFASLSYLIRYSLSPEEPSRTRIPGSFLTAYQVVSTELSRWFPPLLPPLNIDHLKRWPHVQQTIDLSPELLSYLQELFEYKDLGRQGL